MEKTEKEINQKFKILYIEEHGDLKGGGQISLLKLIQHINKNKFEPILIAPYEGSLTAELKTFGIKTIITPMDSPKKKPFLFISNIKKLRKLIEDLKPDIIHCNTSRSVLYGGVASKPLKIPVIWHVRVIESEFLYDRFLVSLCSNVICVSKAVSKRFPYLLKNYSEKVIVIHNGVDLKEFNPEIRGENIRKEFNIPINIPVAGVVGNLIPWKGQKYFIYASEEVIKVFPKAKFLIVGDGETRNYLENLTKKLNLGKNVIFTGKRTDIPQIMAAIDVIVHSSISPEPFARVIIESMAMAKPVIAMNEGGVPEIIVSGKNGILIPPKNTSLMAQEIISLFQDKEKAKKIGLSARKCVEENFSIEENVKKTEQLYLKILKNNENRN